jgi:hypothetical protein
VGKCYRKLNYLALCIIHSDTPHYHHTMERDSAPLWPATPQRTAPEPVPAGLLRALVLALPLSLLLWSGVAAAAWHSTPRPIRHELHQDMAKLWHRAHKPARHN